MPEKMQAFQKEQSAHRAKIMEEFQQTAASLNGKLEDIIQLQLRNVRVIFTFQIAKFTYNLGLDIGHVSIFRHPGL